MIESASILSVQLGVITSCTSIVVEHVRVWPLPVTVSVYVLSSDAVTERDPFTDTDPMPLLKLAESAFVEVQVNVTELPDVIVPDGEALIKHEGAGFGVQSLC